jgi:hypothetical protein
VGKFQVAVRNYDLARKLISYRKNLLYNRYLDIGPKSFWGDFSPKVISICHKYGLKSGESLRNVLS